MRDNYALYKEISVASVLLRYFDFELLVWNMVVDLPLVFLFERYIFGSPSDIRRKELSLLLPLINII